MKKYVFVFALLAMQQLATAQTVNVHFKNGQVIEYPSANVDYVDFSSKPADPTVSSGQAIDLGLSVYWASCNLGADSSEEFGDKYAWGETKTKREFGQNNYSYYDSNTETFIFIGNDISGTQYDAATANLGSDWRMPNATEMGELFTNCTWEWTQINGVNGYKVTGKNGNSIFLPNSFYWTATDGYTKADATALWMDATYRDIKSISDRERGYFIRPVTSNPNAGIDNIDHTNDYLVTDKISATFVGGNYYSYNGSLQSGTIDWKIVNNSSEPITLTRIYMKDSESQSWGFNYLSEDEILAAGESKIFSISFSYNMTSPIVCFKYIYNNKRYSVYANYVSK